MSSGKCWSTCPEISPMQPPFVSGFGGIARGCALQTRLVSGLGAAAASLLVGLVPVVVLLAIVAVAPVLYPVFFRDLGLKRPLLAGGKPDPELLSKRPRRHPDLTHGVSTALWLGIEPMMTAATEVAIGVVWVPLSLWLVIGFGLGQDRPTWLALSWTVVSSVSCIAALAGFRSIAEPRPGLSRIGDTHVPRRHRKVPRIGPAAELLLQRKSHGKACWSRKCS